MVRTMEYIRKIYRNENDYNDFIIVFAKLDGISVTTSIGDRKVEFSDGTSFYLNDSAKFNTIIEEPLFVYRNKSLLDFQFLEHFNYETEDAFIYENKLYRVDNAEDVYRNGVLQAAKFAPLAILRKEDYPRKIDTIKFLRKVLWSNFVLVLSTDYDSVYYTKIDFKFPKYLKKGSRIRFIDKKGKITYSIVRKQDYKMVDVIIKGRDVVFTCHAAHLLYRCGYNDYLMYTG